MELAEPSIQAAVDKCVEQGAKSLIFHPYFLSRGRHVNEDIPNLVKVAMERHQGIMYTITKPLGAQEMILDLIAQSISESKTPADMGGADC